jgi:hypothetical protein
MHHKPLFKKRISSNDLLSPLSLGRPGSPSVPGIKRAIWRRFVPASADFRDRGTVVASGWFDATSPNQRIDLELVYLTAHRQAPKPTTTPVTPHAPCRWVLTINQDLSGGVGFHLGYQPSFSFAYSVM